MLRDSGDRRAARGLLDGLDDPNFDVRYRCAGALVQMQEADPTLKFPSERIFDVAEREAQSDFEYLFTILSLALDRDALRLSLQALSSEDANLRGTALEYLYNVLPTRIRRGLWPRLAKGAPPPKREVPPSELLRSMQSLIIDRDALLAEIKKHKS